MLLSILEEVHVALTAPAAVSADPRFALRSDKAGRPVRAERGRPKAEWLCTCCLSEHRVLRSVSTVIPLEIVKAKDSHGVLLFVGSKLFRA